MRRRQNVVKPEICVDRGCPASVGDEYMAANNARRGSLGPIVLGIGTVGCKLCRSAWKGVPPAHLPSAATMKSTSRALTSNGPNGTFSRFSPPSISSNQVEFVST